MNHKTVMLSCSTHKIILLKLFCNSKNPVNQEIKRRKLLNRFITNKVTAAKESVSHWEVLEVFYFLIIFSKALLLKDFQDRGLI